MTETFPIKLASAYLTAKEKVIELGFAPEIDWQHNLSFKDLTETLFLGEAAWVILSSGMRETVIRAKFPAVSGAFCGWESARMIVTRKAKCRQKALCAFAHAGKIESIFQVAEEVHQKGFSEVKRLLAVYGVEYIHRFPYMGPATSLHLAKNIGLPVVKPDRHLLRVTRVAGYNTPEDMCNAIAGVIGDKISVIDLVIWRYATLNRNYLSLFSI
ncbi:hypothetical protein [Nitrospira sp. Ecomares 2.1]